jgi:hypothetical protein
MIARASVKGIGRTVAVLICGSDAEPSGGHWRA